MKIHPFSKQDASEAFQKLVNDFVVKIRELDNEYVVKASNTISQFNK